LTMPSLAILVSAVLVLSCIQTDRITHRRNQRGGSRCYTHATSIGVSNQTEGTLEKIWYDGVREDMKGFGLFQEDAQDVNRWKRKVKRSDELTQIHVENGH